MQNFDQWAQETHDEDEYRTLQSQDSVRRSLLARLFICGGDLNCQNLANRLDVVFDTYNYVFEIK